MSALGLYFGSKAINIVETKGKKILNNVRIPTSLVSTSSLDDKVPEEVKLVALFKEELRKNHIESKDATIVLSGVDLIIRTFEIPVLPVNELAGAVFFEARKYIPFKIEELVSDFQVRLAKPERLYLVMFMGIRVDTLEKYFSILSQCGIKISSIEYSAFSILRLVELCGLREKGIIGVINFDSQEAEEADFTVIENGFPVFGRDMRFSTRLADTSKGSEDKGMIFEKLKTEIRISLDYYSHKFPTKRIEKMFLVGNQQTRSVIEEFSRKLDLTFKYVDSSRIPGIPAGFNLGFLKAYSSTLAPVIKTKMTIDILSAWEKTKRVRELTGRPKDMLSYLFTGFKLDVRIVIVAVVICVGGFMFGSLQKRPLEAELKELIASRPSVASSVGYDELKVKQDTLNAQITLMNNILKTQVYLTPVYSAISNLIPEGVWLQEFSFSNADNKPKLTLKAMDYYQDADKEIEAAQDFLKSLQKDQRLNKIFKDMSILSLDTSDFKGKKAASFTVVGQG
jgi:hypothetical protein